MLETLLVLLQEGGSAPAEAPAAPPPSTTGFGLDALFLPLILFAIFYLLIFRPQRKQQKQRVKMLSAMKKGDRVLTTGGMFGTIVSLKDEELVLEVDENVRIRFSRGAIAQVIPAEERAKELAPK